MTQRRQRSILRGAAAAGALAALVAVGGCTVDGDATRAEGSGGPAASSTAGAPAPGSAASGSSSGSPSASASSSPSSAAQVSPAPSPGSSSSAPEPAGSGLAARAWTMTCSDYRKLTPDEQKEVTVELGRRLNKKQLRENDRSWAIVNSFCDGGLVRNSPGVRDSE
ncbi:hypothetical protein GOHSU_27_00540 [Gordonia hirsuta DSM 44140 = NBRC 16056]|uniref:Lipoprotein n=1 Tax=Gordonia hirsuta DSM 44140 = NBRC 16056 TaxID=1121927 RepID=L7LCZ7_9ACTN|nr:hypothetical protein [Gordonia hirsuta]GAC57918.1 hypothetical protein GOHSU_27_00540 [Gordonia hirsuta DSM 44140 = NBRC 16056]